MTKYSYDETKDKFQREWNKFITAIRGDLNHNRSELIKVKSEIKRTDRIAKIVDSSAKDIQLLLDHKASFIGFGDPVIKKIEALEGFNKRDNLTNPVAINLSKAILQDPAIIAKINSLDELEEKVVVLESEIDKLKKLIKGTLFDKELIIKLCKKHKINEKSTNFILLYPVTKTPKKIVRTEERVVQEVQEVAQEKVVVPKNLPAYERTYERYEEIRNENNELIEKYYKIINEMTSVERANYEAYCTLKEEELSDIDSLTGEYDEALAKILAFRLFKIRHEIHMAKQTIIDNNYSDIDFIGLLESYINEYAQILESLKERDAKIRKDEQEAEITSNQKVFFATDKNGEPYIPNEVINDISSSISTLIQKVDIGAIKNNKLAIKRLKPEKTFKDALGTPVFMLINQGFTFSYVKLNIKDDKEGGILIITADHKSDNMVELTKRIVATNSKDMVKQMSDIENSDELQLKMQTDLMKNLLGEEGTRNGRK